MGSRGSVKLVAVFEMLDACAPGHQKIETDHYWHITYQDKVYPTLPKGPHGRLGNKEIERGHVKQLVNFLGIRECARRMLPQLIQ